MRKKDKFIFYFGGIISPFIFVLAWGLFIFLVGLVLKIPALILPADLISSLLSGISLLAYPIIGFITVRDVHRNQIINFKKKGGKPPKTILIFFYWLFSLLFFVIMPLLLIIANSNFTSSSSIYSSAVKNGLVNGIKECIVRDAENETTKFEDSQAFSSNYRKFKIKSLDTNSCFKARATTKDNKLTWFEIDYDPETGKVSKTCGDSSKPGCDEGNTW